VPGSDAFTGTSKKRKVDAVGKALVKHPKVTEKKMVETAKISV
jgi:hypothetical protein